MKQRNGRQVNDWSLESILNGVQSNRVKIEESSFENQKVNFEIEGQVSRVDSQESWTVSEEESEKKSGGVLRQAYFNGKSMTFY